ncbi:Gar1/Naf1 RNA binding region-domain-containing protein [Kalaharituber pfeilii]|nr:Gar1/Naf1 RNA binding region-domain-containing protein [Kalaharituber pfeilii]
MSLSGVWEPPPATAPDPSRLLNLDRVPDLQKRKVASTKEAQGTGLFTMDDHEFDEMHVKKKPRLLENDPLKPAVASTVATGASGVLVPESPFPSILESGLDGTDSDSLYVAGDSDGEQSRAKVIADQATDGAASGMMQQSEGASLSGACSSADAKGAGSTTSLFVATTSIPGLFLLQDSSNSSAAPDQRMTATVDTIPLSEGTEAGLVVRSDLDIELIKTWAEDGTMAKAEDVEMEEESQAREEAIDAESGETRELEESSIIKEENGARSPSISPQTFENQRITTDAIKFEPHEPQQLPVPAVEQIKLNEGAENTDSNVMEDKTEEEQEKPKGKAAYDPEFLEAAEANKGNESAEWQLDTSDAESSDDSDDDDSSDSESDSEEESDSEAEDSEFPRLSLAEQARILMNDADEDVADKANAKGERPRTKNEVPDESIEAQKPNVVLTDVDVLEELGEIQSIVEKIAVIKAKTSGEYQVLNEGSVLALGNRTVIGVVADLLGRVQSPLYTVRFNATEEISQYGLKQGTKIFYSPKHSTFVFTKVLKAQKGSDASNWHDEEVDENEVEFSDDEAEAEYKRKMKEKKSGGEKGGKANRRGHHSTPSAASGGMPSTSDEPYTPLPRPPNLSELMKSVAHMKQPEEPAGLSPDRSGSGFSRNRDRGDWKGRGPKVHKGGKDKGGKDKGGKDKGGKDKGGKDERRGGGKQSWAGGRGGQDDHRGGGYGRERDNQPSPQIQNPQSQPYYNNAASAQTAPQQPIQSYKQAPQAAYSPGPSVPQYGYHYGGYTQQFPQTQHQNPYASTPYQFPVPPSPLVPQQIQNPGVLQQPTLFPASPLSPSIPKLPQGAHINPAFFARQTQTTPQQGAYMNPQMLWGQQQQPSPPSATGQFGWPSPQAMAPALNQVGANDAIMKAVQDQLDILKGIKK